MKKNRSDRLVPKSIWGRPSFAASIAAGLLGIAASATAEVEWLADITPAYQRWTAEAPGIVIEDEAFRTGLTLGVRQVKDQGFLFGANIETYFNVGGIESRPGLAATSFTFGLNPEIEAVYRYGGMNKYRLDTIVGFGLDYWHLSGGNAFGVFSIGSTMTTYAKVGLELQPKEDRGYLVGAALVYPMSAEILSIDMDGKPGFDVELGYQFRRDFFASVVYEGRFYDQGNTDFSRSLIGLKLGFKF